jgi:hypothetical protein
MNTINKLNKKSASNRIWFLVGVIVLVGGGLLIRYIITPIAQTVLIPHVTQHWQYRFEKLKGDPFNQNLLAEVHGHLDGNATIIFAGGSAIELTAGEVDQYIILTENWDDSCTVEYAPINVTNGHLSVTAIVGSKGKRSILNEAGPANAMGGWVTYYPNSEKKYCTGYYFRGKKVDEWTYFDIDGKVTRVEFWKSGHLETNVSGVATP